MENNKEYIFLLNWEDNMKNLRKVGYFAYIQDNFYLLVSRKEDAETAYANGFVGIPAFKAGEVYRSSELFEFFKNRIDDKNSNSIYEALIKHSGASNIDSFSLGKVPDKLVDIKKKALLEVYEKQQKLKEIENKKREDIEINA